MLNEQAAAVLMGDELQLLVVPGCSLITFARNQLVAEFLQSDAERLVFVDADVAWDPGAVLKIAHHPVEVVGGAYRFKKDEEAYPVTFIPGEIWGNRMGLIEVEALPGGFLAVNREALKRFEDKFPDRGYAHCGKNYFAYFHAPFRNKELFGEDNSFCAEFREAGGQVWLDPELTLTHMESGRAYVGHIGKWLKGRNGEQ